MSFTELLFALLLVLIMGGVAAAVGLTLGEHLIRAIDPKSRAQ